MDHSILAKPPVKLRLAEDADQRVGTHLAAGDPLALTILVEQYCERITMLAARLLGWKDGGKTSCEASGAVGSVSWRGSFLELPGNDPRESLPQPTEAPLAGKTGSAT